MASNPQHSTDSRDLDWDACAPGELQGLGQRLRGEARRRRAVVPGLAGGAALVLACVVLASGETSPQAISCSVCKSRFAEYNDYLTALSAAQPGQPAPEADATLAEVRRHLEECRGCRGSFERAYPDAVLSLAAIGVGTALALSLLVVTRPRANHSSVWPTGP